MPNPRERPIDKNNSVPPSGAIYSHEFIVCADAIDGSVRVNNVSYIQWMQDMAFRHFRAIGVMDAMNGTGGTWVVRSHKVEYLHPALAGDRARAATWVAGLGRGHRRYRFTRVSDGKLLAKGETEWVYVDSASGRPSSIPASIRQAFTPSLG